MRLSNDEQETWDEASNATKRTWEVDKPENHKRKPRKIGEFETRNNAE